MHRSSQNIIDQVLAQTVINRQADQRLPEHYSKRDPKKATAE
ncbi:hypothetical protein [Synechococcus sp. Cu2B8-bc1011]